MEFNVSSAELLKGLMDVSKAVPVKSALPILEDFLFVVRDDATLEVTASDQTLTLRTVIGLESVSGTGSMAVPARQIIDLVKTIPDQPICVITESDTTFKCIWSNGDSILPYHDADEYPEITWAGEDFQSITLPAQNLVDGIAGTLYAVADDEMRPAMNGIFFDFSTGSTTLVASDSHKLICFTDEALKAPFVASFILDKKPAAILRGIIGKDVEEVSVSFDTNSAVFQFGRTMMMCRLIVGRYPKYREVIPQNNSNVLSIDRQQLLNTVTRVAVCASKASNHIKMDLRQGQLEMTAQDSGFSTSAYEKLECDYNGAAISIGFKSNFLRDILANMTCETIVMKFADARRAALIVPSPEEAAKERVCGIIMPVMVS